MKYLKMLGLAAIAAGALMAFAGAGTASATVLTCEGSTCKVGATFHSVSKLATLDAPFGNVECESTVHGHVITPGSATDTAEVEITELKWINCLHGDVVNTLKPGKLVIHTTEEAKNIDNGDGTVTSVGAEVTVEHVGTHCIFGTGAAGTDIGWATGTNHTGGTGVLDISATIPRVGGRSGVFCGSSAPWTGSYSIDTPMTGEIH
jgi:hypothetical protein